MGNLRNRMKASAATRPEIWRARCDTDHFSFEAFGGSEEGAMAAMKRGFAQHARQLSLPANWYLFYEKGIEIEQIEQGAVYRDGEKL